MPQSRVRSAGSAKFSSTPAIASWLDDNCWSARKIKLSEQTEVEGSQNWGIFMEQIPQFSHRQGIIVDRCIVQMQAEAVFTNLCVQFR